MMRMRTALMMKMMMMMIMMMKIVYAQVSHRGSKLTKICPGAT